MRAFRLACILTLLTSGPARSQDQKPGQLIEPVEGWTNVFAAKQADAARDVDVHLTIHAPKDFKGRLAWSFAVGQATIQRQEMALPEPTKGPAKVKIGLRVPFVREGVVAQAKLAVALIRDGQNAPAATYEKRLWIYPYEPFFDRASWLKSLKITLYDPKETTAALLKKMGVPFEEVRSAAALADLKDGLVLVGEGMSFDDERALPEILIKLAAAGLPVLCLAPAQGTLPLPGADNTLPAPSAFAFRGAEVITRVDKRLDAHGWAGKVNARVLAIKTADGSVVAEIMEGRGSDGRGWPWLEMRYPGRGRLVLCGFGIMSHWEAGPTSRFLFARTLEFLTDQRDTEPDQRKEP
jgi:hypothetical protein